MKTLALEETRKFIEERKKKIEKVYPLWPEEIQKIKEGDNYACVDSANCYKPNRHSSHAGIEVAIYLQIFKHYKINNYELFPKCWSIYYEVENEVLEIARKICGLSGKLPRPVKPSDPVYYETDNTIIYLNLILPLEKIRRETKW